MKRIGAWFKELRRRRVIRAAGGYAVVSFVILQVTDLVLPALPFPPETTGFVLLLLALGFPIVIVLAWAYDITPDGIQKTDRDRWQRIEALFDEAIALPPSARPAFLRRVAAHDAALRRELETLLHAHSDTGPLDVPIANWLEPAPEGEITAGRTIAHSVCSRSSVMAAWVWSTVHATSDWIASSH